MEDQNPKYAQIQLIIKINHVWKHPNNRKTKSLASTKPSFGILDLNRARTATTAFGLHHEHSHNRKDVSPGSKHCRNRNNDHTYQLENLKDAEAKHYAPGRCEILYTNKKYLGLLVR